MNKIPMKGTKEYAMADALSRPNAINGLYKKLRFPLEWKDLNRKDAFYITSVADLADRIIMEAEEGGKNLENQKVQEELQAAFYGGMTGISVAIKQHKFLRFLGFRRG